MTDDPKNVGHPDKWCSYCRKYDHNDSECWCTRPANWKETPPPVVWGPVMQHPGGQPFRVGTSTGVSLSPQPSHQDAAPQVPESARTGKGSFPSNSPADAAPTPRTDYAATLVQFAVVGKDQYEVVSAEFSRQLERELAIAVKALREDCGVHGMDSFACDALRELGLE